MRLRAAAMIGVLAAGCASQHPSAPVTDRTARSGAPQPPPVAKVTAPTPRTLSDEHYEVKRGDTLYSIALEHGVDYRELAQWNALDDPTRIRVGQVLRVKPDESRGVQIGRANIGARVESRPLDAPAPVVKLPPKEPSKEPETVQNAEFMWPAKGKILAGFAEPRSKGIDIDGRPGDPIVAAAAGRVTYIGSGIPGLGKLVVIKHDNGFITVYAHNRDILVKEQQNVARGQKIAELGSSDADRPKLHFQIRKGSAAVDPLRYLPAL
ncbi:MAG: LysM peptidoglycan-binding domain-containing protein [Betaproteobacteria bacterium]|nr:MAG: LysM peptidoglycan-binding domain-containing protein [Betaproteobacteria bacterium]